MSVGEILLQHLIIWWEIQSCVCEFVLADWGEGGGGEVALTLVVCLFLRDLPILSQCKNVLTGYQAWTDRVRHCQYWLDFGIEPPVRRSNRLCPPAKILLAGAELNVCPGQITIGFPFLYRAM